MKTSQFYIIMIAGVTLAALCSCGFKREKITRAPPIKVAVMPAAASSTAGGRTYSGTVTTGEGAHVSFPMPGTVEAIYVKSGQKVAKGQLLAKIKSGTLENNYNIAQAALAEAQDAYNRYAQLHAANALAEIKWVEVQNTLKQAKNAAEVARRALDDAKLHAPTGGIIAEKHIDVGQTVVPAVPAFDIVALSDVKVSIPVPENEIDAFKEGSSADIIIGALDSLRLVGTLTEKGVVSNPLTRTYNVKFSINNPDGKILPGMICSVAVRGTSAATEPAIILPPQSVLLAADNRNFVWLAKAGRAERRFVEAPSMTAEGIIISSGLEPSDTVIIAGMQKVSDGTPVITQL